MRHPSSHPSRNPSKRFLTFREPFNVSFSVVAPTSVRKRERAATPSLARGGRKEISEIKRRRYSVFWEEEGEEGEGRRSPAFTETGIICD